MWENVQIFTVLVILTTLASLPDSTCGQQCPVNPVCECSKRDGTDVLCLNLEKNLTAFLPSNTLYRRLFISSVQPIIIAKDTFQRILITDLTLGPTRMSTFGCTDFSGLASKLKSVEFVNNLEMVDVPSCTLSPLTKLKKLVFFQNGISALRKQDFSSLAQLESLHLSWNNISSIEPGSFAGLVSLRSLNLNGNMLKQINRSLFSELRRLEKIYLQDNYIESLPEELFQMNTNLKFVHLSNNRIANFPHKLLSPLVMLAGFYASGNVLFDIPMDFFNNTAELRILHLNNNRLGMVNPDGFRGLKKLEYLYLSNNRNVSDSGRNNIEMLLIDVYRHWPKIRTIQCKNNSIVTLQAGAFKNLKTLTRLSLENNKLTEIPRNVFANSSRLKHVHLQHNMISGIDNSVVLSLGPQLRELNLSRNVLSPETIAYLMQRVPIFYDLRKLDLSHNMLPTLSPDTIQSFKNLMQLNLKNCSLTETTDFGGTVLPGYTDVSSNSLTTFGGSDKSVIITGSSVNVDVSGNDLQELNIIINHENITNGRLNASQNQIESVSIHASPNTAFEKLHLNGNRIKLPMVFSNEISVHVLDLAENSLRRMTIFPLKISNNGSSEEWNPCTSSLVNSLNLSWNSIVDISPNACLGRVQNLDLSYNNLETLKFLMPTSDASTFRLLYLNLMGNRLTVISPDSFGGVSTRLWELDLRFNQIATLSKSSELLSMTKLQKLYLAGNPINCDCDGASLRSSSLVNRLDDVRCQLPPEFNFYLVICYSLVGCASNSLAGTTESPTAITNTTTTTCENDFGISTSNFSVNSNNDSVMVEWSVAGPGVGYIDLFRLTYKDESSASTNQRLIPANNQSVVLFDLLCGHQYSICVSPRLSTRTATDEVCREVKLFQTPCVEQRKSKPVAIENFTFKRDKETVILDWSIVGPGQVYVQHLSLEYSDFARPTEVTKRILQPDQRSYVLTGLQPESSYKVCIIGQLNYGSSTAEVCNRVTASSNVARDTAIAVVIVLLVIIVVVVLVWKRRQLKLCFQRRSNNSHLNGDQFHEHIDNSDARVTYYQPMSGTGYINGSHDDDLNYDSDVKEECNMQSDSRKVDPKRGEDPSHVHLNNVNGSRARAGPLDEELDSSKV